MSDDLLSRDEIHALALTVKLSLTLSRIVGTGPTREADIAELYAHVHGIQNAVMAQAAARHYPAFFRTLGEQP